MVFVFQVGNCHKRNKEKIFLKNDKNKINIIVQETCK